MADNKKIAVKPKRKCNAVRVSFYDELKSTSNKSQYNMSTLLEIAWKYFKSSDWYKIAIKEK